MRKRTHEEYIHQLTDTDLEYKCTGVYSGSRNKVSHKYTKCGYEWMALPRNILNGHGCPNCANSDRAEKNRKTPDRYMIELAKIDPDIVCLGEYTTAHSKILHNKISCSHQPWYASPIIY